MKKLLTLLLFSFGLHAQTTHRITAGMNLQDAITNAASGDIYLVEGGIQVTNLDIDKKVTIIGTGYFLTADYQASQAVSKVGHIRLSPGSDGTYITGLQTLSINISANDVIIQRCYVEGDNGRIRIGYTGIGDGGGNWNGTANNVQIIQNYFARIEILAKDIEGITTSTCHNFIIKNNIIFRYGFHLQGRISGEIINNTFAPVVVTNEGYHSILRTDYDGTWYASNVCGILPVIFKNNILNRIIGDCPITSNLPADFNGNVFTQDFTNLPSSNTINADPNSLFLGYPTNPNNALAPDARAQLAAGSPAKGAGVGGVDAGAFGGDMPYVLSGIPSAPNIYQLNVPLQTTQNGTLNVQIKAKTNN